MAGGVQVAGCRLQVAFVCRQSFLWFTWPGSFNTYHLSLLFLRDGEGNFGGKIT